MHSILFMLSLSSLFELMVHVVRTRYGWLRSLAAIAALVSVIFCMEAIVILHLSAGALLVGYAGLYRIFNICRVLKGRMHASYLWRMTFRTSLWLIASQYIIVGGWMLWNRYDLTLRPVLFGVLIGLALFAVLMWRSLARHISRMKVNMALETVGIKDWPSLTVAIPARNETDSLHDCLKSVLASQYPKLEILVLDDNSQSPRTPEIIRSFAHDGVRFIQGPRPNPSWLAKNQAYETLAKEASGEYVVFMGADVRLQPFSLRRAAAYALENHKSMLSVMPHNVIFDHRPSLIQPMRYLWEVGLPRRLVRRPPVLSTFWFIDKSMLGKWGGFSAATRMVVPEAYFARQAVMKDTYSFLISGPALGITSLKDRTEQKATAVRAAYPSMHRRPEMAALISLACLVWAIAPAASLMSGILDYRQGAVMIIPILGLAIIILWGAVYARLLKLSYGHVQLVSLLSLPLAILNYAWLLNYSMYKYEFAEVLWKGRNVIVPVMHVVPHLPPIGG